MHNSVRKLISRRSALFATAAVAALATGAAFECMGQMQGMEHMQEGMGHMQGRGHMKGTPAEAGAAPVSGLTGEGIYATTCAVCHGPDGKGVLPGVPDFTREDGPLAKPDSLLLKHALEGFQSPGSPMAMPPKGGNPELTEQDLKRALAYIRQRFGS